MAWYDDDEKCTYCCSCCGCSCIRCTLCNKRKPHREVRETECGDRVCKDGDCFAIHDACCTEDECKFAHAKGVWIKQAFYPFETLEDDVRVAVEKGFTGRYAFTPETVRSLLEWIKTEKTAKE